MQELKKIQDSRRTFIDTLIELREKDDKVLLIVPDVGFHYIDAFKDRFPESFFNFGVTEQSTMIIASALALDGWRPFVYSMINFVLFRPGEMVRNAVVSHHAPVVLLGVKGSESYKFLGFSHNLIHDDEDFVFCDNIGLEWSRPDSNEQVRVDVLEAYQSKQPRYIRL